MQDAVLNNTGNSRKMRTIAGIKNIVQTLDDLLDLMIAGEFPFDISDIDPDGWATIGTYLNKANLLTDATAALADLGPEATPNEMFAALANSVNSLGNQQEAISQLQTKVNSLITYGTTDLTAGVSPLPTGTIYLVYE